MTKYILLIITGGSLAFTAGAWVYIFWQILIYDGVALVEPNEAVLITEFSLAIILTLLGLGTLILGLVKGKG